MQSSDLAPLLPAIALECQLRYPAEACGLILSSASGGLRFAAIPNIAGTSAASGTSSRTGRDGYVMDGPRLLAELEQAESTGGALVGIAHSHPDVGAYFSREDREMALGGGLEPLWPGVDYLVVSCRAGRTDDARLYRWDPTRGDFLEEILPMPRLANDES